MSAPNEQPSASGVLAGSTGRATADGSRLYRLVSPVVIWWIWAAVTVLSLGDLLFQGHDVSALQFALGWLTATGVVFACTLWPRVIASEDSITVLNPFRVFVIPWSAVQAIFLGDSVEIRCARGGDKKDKTVYSWALAAPRRARAKSQLRGRQLDRGTRGRPSSYSRMPQEARALAKMTSAELIARELAQMLERVRGRADAGPPAVAMTARWPWQPLAAMLVPAAALAIALLIR